MSGKKSAIVGIANELVTLGLLLPRFPNTMLSAHQLSSHDIIIPLSNGSYVRAQVKTAKKSVTFTGGQRGGVDRTYDSETNESKEYKYSTKDTDIIIGITEVRFGTYELYFVPSLVVEKLNQKSISINKIAFTKNELSYIEHCKDAKFCEEKFQNLMPPIRPRYHCTWPF